MKQRNALKGGHVRFEAPAPNILHHVGFSESEYFRPVIENGNWFAEVRPRSATAKTKDQQGDMGMSLRVIALVDDYSRPLRAQYVISQSESSIVLIPFLQSVWRQIEGSAYGGLPEIVMSRNGPPFTSNAFQTMLQAVDDRLQLIGPAGLRWERWVNREGPTGGKLKTAFRTMWSGFELIFLVRHERERIPIGTLAQLFESWVADYNERKHPYYKNYTRSEIWRESIARIRQVPRDVLSAKIHQERVKVTRDSFILFEGERFRTNSDVSGMWVDVSLHLSGEVFVVTPSDEMRKLVPVGHIFLR